MTVGWLANLVVIVANGAMPTPAAVIGGPEWWPNIGLAPHLVGHVPIDGSTQLPWLADSIEVRLPHVLAPMSVGDILLFAGVITFIVSAMRFRPAMDPAGSPGAPAADVTSASTGT
jgi:hypothetical protein